MAKKQSKTVVKPKQTFQTNQKRTPGELRKSLQEHDIHTTANSQLQALGAIYRVATHEPEVNLRTLLSAIGRVQNLHSLGLRAAVAQTKKGLNGKFFLGE